MKFSAQTSCSEIARKWLQLVCAPFFSFLCLCHPELSEGQSGPDGETLLVMSTMPDASNIPALLDGSENGPWDLWTGGLHV